MSGEFAGMLRERIVIERSTEERNAMGLQEHHWMPVVRCRASVIPEGMGPEQEGMALSAMQRFSVTIRNRGDVGIDQRVRWAGRQLMVRQLVFDPRFRDRLTMRCEEVRQ